MPALANPPSNRRATSPRKRPVDRPQSPLRPPQAAPDPVHQPHPVADAPPASAPAAKPSSSASPVRGFFEGATIRRSLALFGLTAGLAVSLVCGLDLLLGEPLNAAIKTLDVTYIVCGVALGGLSWSVYRELG